MTITPRDTQAYLPWPEAVTVTSARQAGDVAEAVTRAGVYRLGTAEAGPSRGVATAARVKVTIGQGDVTFAPKPYDRVTWKGTDYTVQTVDGSDWMMFWVLDCVALAIANDLADTGTLYRPANTADAAGKRIPGVAAVTGATAIPCRVQPVSATPDDPFDALVLPGRYRAYLDRQVYPEADDVFGTADGRRFTVKGWGDAELIGRVPYLDLELIS